MPAAWMGILRLMTLVVARLFSDGPRLVSDSKLTPKRGVLNPYTEGALKAVILHRGLCVAFAGGSVTAPQAILDLGVSPTSGFDVDEVCRELYQATRRAAGADDFIVAALAPERMLITVDASGISRGRTDAWIGDEPAYEAYFQNLSRADEVPSDHVIRPLPAARRLELAEWNRMFPSFVQVIEDVRFPTVGGVPISVAPTSGGFRYESSAVLAADHEQVVRPEDGWVKADWGSAAQGAFGYAVKTPDDPGVGAVGAYFPHGRLGILYYPGRYLRPIVWREIDDSEFSEAVREEFGIAFGEKSLGFTPN